MIKVILSKNNLSRTNAMTYLNNIKKWCNNNKIDYEFCHDIQYYINAMTCNGFGIIPWFMDDTDVWVEFAVIEDAVAFKLAFL